MNIEADAIVAKIRALEQELEAEFAKQRAGLRFGLERGKARFEAEVIRTQKALKVGAVRYLLNARVLVVLTAPVIYSLIIPYVLIDVWSSLYQAVCFRVYGIPQVQRSRYLVFDRSGLAYLNAVQKLNCAYCSYANGVVAYVREIAARTEQYWCPIKHARHVLGSHLRYAQFGEYGDAENFQVQLTALRAALKAEQNELLNPSLTPRP